jgi:hypothetical protein
VKFLLNPVGLLVLIVMVTAWPWAAYRQYPAIVQTWTSEVGGTATGTFRNEPVWTYLHRIPAVLLPWTPLMAVGAWSAWRRGDWRKPLWQFFICWFLPGILLLHFSAQKSKHYPIPMLPPLSILGAIGLLRVVRFQQESPKANPRLGAILWTVGTLAAIAGTFVLKSTRPMAPELTIALAVLLVGGLVAIALEAGKRLDGQLVAIMATVVVVVVVNNVWIMGRHFNDFGFAREFALSVNERVPPGERLYIIDAEHEVDPHVAYYLRAPLWRFADEEQFVTFAHSAPGQIYVVGIADHAEKLASAGAVRAVIAAPAKPRREQAHHRWTLYHVAARP